LFGQTGATSTRFVEGVGDLLVGRCGLLWSHHALMCPLLSVRWQTVHRSTKAVASAAYAGGATSGLTSLIVPESRLFRRAAGSCGLPIL